MNAITAGEAYVEVTCETGEARRQVEEFASTIAAAARNVQSNEEKLSPKIKTDSIDDAKKKIEEYKEAAKKVGEACEGVVAKTLGMISSFAQAGDVFDKMSQRTGISAQSLSELSYAANLSGTSIEQVEDAMKSLSEKLVDATNNGGDAAEAFSSIGLNATELLRLSPEEQLDKISDAIAGISDPTRRSAAAMEIFGDAGAQLLPLLSSGSAGLSEMKNEARELGASISDSAAKTSAEYNDAVARMTTVCASFKNSISEALLPSLIMATDAIRKISSYVSKFSREHPTTTKAIVATSAAIIGTIAATSGLIRVVGNCTAAFNLFGNALRFLAASNPAILALTAAIAAAGAAAAFYFSQKRDADVWSDEKQKALEAGEAQREQDMERFHRLEELAAKESLTTSEIAEAARLASILNETYGEIGVSVDAVTGKINVANGAQEKLNKKMMEAKAKELEAAINEKKANAQGQNIEKKLAREEVSWSELALGRRRGDSWWDWATEFKSYDTDDEASLAILENDKAFQARAKAAKEKNQSEINTLQAELDALRANMNKPEESPEETEKSKEEKRKKEEARRKRENAEYDLIYDTSSTEMKARMSGNKLIEAGNVLLKAQQGGDDEQIAEATRKYTAALRTYESDKDALNRENESKAKEQERQRQEREKEQERAKEERQAAESAYFDQNATLEERWNKSFEELQEARQELTKAQKSGDDATIAAALRKLTGSQSKFESLDQEVQRQYEEGMAEETTNAIQKKVESTGTFSAYQAQAWGAGMDGQRKLYEENKRQTEYLRRLVDLMGSSSAAFV